MKDVWGLWVHFSGYSPTILNIETTRTRVGAGHQRSHPRSHAITATILIMKENLNISAHRSRHILFINKSQTRARRWVHNSDGGVWCNAFGVFWNMLHRCVHQEELLVRCCSEHYSLRSRSFRTNWFWLRYQKDCRKESVFRCFLSASMELKQSCSFVQRTKKITRLAYQKMQQYFQNRSTITAICV